ncbi:MAG TPA: dihydrolipoyl dehydrogenase [Vicinamibacterales bacterium]|nr:dihydrolipoyl dehydrogenase [Vicinamibacterales bacterium]
MEAISTELAVVGAGPGGYAAAFYAADLGMRVVLIDADPNPGGVCLYRGCIPSKALLHAARVITEAEEAAAWGIAYERPRIDLDRLRDWKASVVSKLTGGLGQLAKQRRIEYLQGRAAFEDARRLRVALASGGERLVAFEHAILATGSRPATLPGLPEDPRILDSTSALDLPDIPKRLLVVGGGYIGLELGTVYAALGSEVWVVEMTDGLLPGVDRDLVGVLARRAEKMFARVLLRTRVAGIEPERRGLRVRFEGEAAPAGELFDRVLVAVGRRPNSSVPGLDRTRVRTGSRGFVEVDAARRTAEPSIFAIGDVAGEPMLAHKASHEARTAVDAIAGRRAAFEPNAIPAVVFTDPEIAWCGLTETEAAARGLQVETARFPWAASGRALTLDRADGVTKLVLEPDTGRVLGVGIAGVGAGELIAEGVLAVEMGALASDVAMSIHPHPTLSETIMEAAEVFFGHATHVHRPKRRTAG